MLRELSGSGQKKDSRPSPHCAAAPLIRLPCMTRPNHFEYSVRGNDVTITHHGKVATTLRGNKATAFLRDVELGDPQELMARLTGNYRRGNERQARNHPRNRGH